MKYLILIQSNPKSLAVWETMSEAQRMEFGRAHLSLTDTLAESGELIVSEDWPTRRWPNTSRCVRAGR